MKETLRRNPLRIWVIVMIIVMIIGSVKLILNVTIHVRPPDVFAGARVTFALLFLYLYRRKSRYAFHALAIPLLFFMGLSIFGGQAVIRPVGVRVVLVSMWIAVLAYLVTLHKRYKRFLTDTREVTAARGEALLSHGQSPPMTRANPLEVKAKVALGLESSAAAVVILPIGFVLIKLARSYLDAKLQEGVLWACGLVLLWGLVCVLQAIWNFSLAFYAHFYNKRDGREP